MTAALTAAHAAFQLSTTVLEQVGETPAKHTEKATSPWDRWPVAIAGLTCAISIINSIALGALGNIPMGVLIGISALGSGSLMIYLWSFSTLKSLEGYVEAFSERVTALAKTSLRLSSANKELDTTRLSLEADLKKRQVLFDEQKKEVGRIMAQLDHATDDLQKTEKQVVEMGKILDGSHSVISEMTSKIGAFVTLNRDVSTSSKLLTEGLSSIHAIGSQLESTVDELDDQNELLLDKKKQAEAIAKGLYDQFTQIAQLLVDLRKQRESLESNLKALQQVDTSLAAHSTELHHVAEDISKGAHEAQSFVDSLKQYDGLAATIRDAMAKSKAEEKH